MAEKTKVPGMDYEDSCGATPSSDNLNSFGPGRSKFNPEGTTIPGMDNVPGKANVTGKAKSRPLVGFLYSISKTPYGEFWPVYLGQNTIGRSKSSDIQLNEGTVSSEHAVLTVMKDSEGMFAAIENSGINGVKLNGKSIRLNRVECGNQDKLLIGSNYELLLVLVDADALGLKTSESFVERREERASTSRIYREGEPQNNNVKSRISNNDGGTVPTDSLNGGNAYDQFSGKTR